MRIFNDSLVAFEEIVKETRGKYCVGDELTYADCFLIPQLNAAQRFEVDLEQFPNILELKTTLEAIPEIAAADAKNQPDFTA